ncbi:hypothetical protein D3C86_2219290 [compost metagenome]
MSSAKAVRKSADSALLVASSAVKFLTCSQWSMDVFSSTGVMKWQAKICMQLSRRPSGAPVPVSALPKSMMAMLGAW